MTLAEFLAPSSRHGDFDAIVFRKKDFARQFKDESSSSRREGVCCRLRRGRIALDELRVIAGGLDIAPRAIR